MNKKRLTKANYYILFGGWILLFFMNYIEAESKYESKFLLAMIVYSLAIVFVKLREVMTSEK